MPETDYPNDRVGIQQKAEAIKSCNGSLYCDEIMMLELSNK